MKRKPASMNPNWIDYKEQLRQLPSLSQVGGTHYKKLVIQPAEFCQRNRLGFLESTVVKYVCRHRDKAGAVDVRKAIHCLELLLEYEYDTRGEGQEEGQEGTEKV